MALPYGERKRRNSICQIRGCRNPGEHIQDEEGTPYCICAEHKKTHGVYCSKCGQLLGPGSLAEWSFQCHQCGSD